MMFRANFLIFHASVIALACACGSSAEDTATPSTPSAPKEDTRGQRPAPPEEEEQPPKAPDTWCTKQAGTHAFCADFDGLKLNDGWDHVWYPGTPSSPGGKGYKAISSDRSAPNALSITENPVASGETQGAPSFSRRMAMANAKGARVALDLRIDEIGIDNDTYALAPLSLSFMRTEGKGWVHVAAARLDLRSTKTELHATPEVKGGQWHVPAEHLPRGRWVHVEIVVDLGSIPATATMSYDGKVVASGSYGDLDASTIDTLDLGIGMNLHSPHANTFSAAFDNVVLDLL